MILISTYARASAQAGICSALAVSALALTGCGGGDDRDRLAQDGMETLQAAGAPIYKVILGHDGHPDPDDNLAALAGYMAAKRNQEGNSSRLQLVGMVYGDTTEARQQAMITGSGTGDATDDQKAKANYAFYQQYTVPALQSVGLSNFRDITPQAFDFTPSALTDMTTGGRLIANTVKSALDNATTNYRVVYSAGGGENAAAEAIAWLRQSGYSDAQIKGKFAIVQHSAWNWKNANEETAKTIAAQFTIRIEDQNKYSGNGKPPLTVSASRTSSTFVNAWNVAIGSTTSGIPNFQGKRDASDGGGHHFSTDPTALDSNWNTRNNDLSKSADVAGDIGSTIFYDKYKTAQMNADMN